MHYSRVNTDYFAGFHVIIFTWVRNSQSLMIRIALLSRTEYIAPTITKGAGGSPAPPFKDTIAAKDITAAILRCHGCM